MQRKERIINAARPGDNNKNMTKIENGRVSVKYSMKCVMISDTVGGMGCCGGNIGKGGIEGGLNGIGGRGGGGA